MAPRKRTYCRELFAIVLTIAMATFVPAARAQNCSQNMLTITGAQSYVATPGVPALNLTKGFTVECWAKITSAVNGSALVDKGAYGLFCSTDSTLFGMVRHSNQYILNAPPVDSPAVWHHYAFVFTPGDSMRLYVDTVEVASEKAPVALLDSNTDSLRIGMSIAGNSVIGSIDELRLWNTPRTLANIEQTLYYTAPKNDSGLVLYYSFDDDAGAARVHDFSGHGRDGFIRGTHAEIVPSSSPMLNASPGFALAAVEPRIIIPTLRCVSSFDTVIHVRNLGPIPLYVDTVGFHLGVAFSIVPNAPFTLPADSTKVDSLRLHFEPATGGVFSDSLYVASSTICGGSIVIGIQAAYDSVGLTSSPDTLKFGSLTQCQLPSVRTITLTNTSATDSEAILSFVPPPGSGLLVLDSFPIHLAPRQDTTVTVELLPGTRGPLTVALGFDLNKCSREAMVNATAVRQLSALAMPDTINFGSFRSSLAGITRDTTIIVTNIGDNNNDIASIGAAPDSLIQILDGRKGIVKAPGDTLQVHVRMLASSCGMLLSELKLKSYYCSVDTSTIVTMTVIPPLPVTVPALNMGISCLGRDTAIYIHNPNDSAVALDTISFSTNGVFSSSPFFPILIPPHDSAVVQMEFGPSANGSFFDTAYFPMSPCGAGMAVFSGQMGFHGLAFSAPQLLFGRGCKTDSVSRQDTLVNRTSDTITLLSNTYSGSSRFSITPFSFPVVLPPGASQAIWVTYSPSLNALDTAIFTFVSADGCPAASFTLRGSREIAQATWQNPVGAFDTVCPGNSEIKTFSLIDHGIDSIDVLSAFVTDSAFTLLKSPSTFGDTGIFQIEFAPNAEQEYSGMLTVTVDSCGTSFSLPLTGSGGPTPSIVPVDSVVTFDSIAIGYSVTYCIAVTNPSCSPITIALDSSTLAGSPFTITSPPNPSQISRGDTSHFCVVFHPTAYGNFQSTLLITSDSAGPRTITLRGVGLAPDVRFQPHLLDFGYVLIGSDSTLMIYDTNAGNLLSVITAFHSTPVFSVAVPAALPPVSADSFAVTFQPLANTGPIYDTLRLMWNGGEDTVILLGFGTSKGLQTSDTILNFGHVHIGNDSTIPLYLFATNNFPTIDSVHIYWINSAPQDTFSVSADSALPFTIKNPQDSLTLNVTYHALLKQSDSGILVIHTGTDSVIIPLTGRGVEAQPWINPDSIPFIGIFLDTPTSVYPLQIGNSGSYPLYINSIISSDPAFTASPIPDTEAILPGGTWNDTVTFTPARTRLVTATLSFFTSYRDSVLVVKLTGSGKYPAGTGPSFGYSVASSTVEPGQNDTIPVTMNGVLLNEIDEDSTVLDFHFDPQMALMYGADGGSSLQPATRFALLNDSTVEASVPRSIFTGGTVMRLYAQALLGPHDTTYIHVIQSTPLADQPESATDGAFIEAACGGPVQGVIFAGPYSTNAIVPNPAGDKATLQFELGLAGPVTLDFYNAIGQLAKHLDFGTVNAGSYTLPLDVSDLPQGRYVYRLKSLEYQSQGALVIVR